MSSDRLKLSVVPQNDQNLPCQGHLKNLLGCNTIRIVSPQHIIFSQGEFPHSVCLICNGLVKLTRTESNGKPVIVGLRRKGWLLGAGALLPGRPYASTAETVTRCKLCFIPIEKMKQASETDPLFSNWIATIYSGEVYHSMITICERSSLSGRQRLEKFLCEIIRVENTCDTEKAVKILIPLKLWEVSQLLALTQQHLCRLIKDMENEGIILRKKGWIIVLKPKKLWCSETATNKFI